LRFWWLRSTIGGVAGVNDELLSTGEAARMLGVSRQHVVNLCTQGRLPFATVGTHRRLRRADVEAMLSITGLSREAERSLWVHRAVAGKVVLDPDASIELAQRNLARMLQVHTDGMSRAWLIRWESVLDHGVDAVLETLSSVSADAVELRQNSPFAGILTEQERTAVRGAFRAHWRRTHDAA
jgi:excisionase family DNA binding protein